MGSIKKAIQLVLILLTATSLAAGDEFRFRGTDYTERFLAGDISEIWKAMTPDMQQAMGSAQALGEFRQSVMAQAGTPGLVVGAELSEQDGFHVFRQIRQFSELDRPIVFQWVFDDALLVAGFFVKPLPLPPSDTFEDYRTRTELHLPFSGEWFVFWGGRTRDENYHVDHANQRYAYDLVVLEKRSSHDGDPLVKENYHCWGKAILAPANGTVAVAQDGLPDQVPGQMDPMHPPGNHVIIDHGNGEYSVLAHLQQGSVQVRAGDTVSTRQMIGRCGNSGNTSEPHLHYHLQNGSRFGEGHGLPAPFVELLIDGRPVTRGEPVRGQTVEPADRQP